jgi:hypothetical protein
MNLPRTCLEVNGLLFFKRRSGKAFVPDSQRWKNIEDVTKNINMFAQLHSAVFTAFFTDPLSAGMVYKRLGASWWKGVSNSIEGSIKGIQL